MTPSELSGPALPVLEVGRVYTSAELGELFGFSPYYLRTAGGMVPVRKTRSLILVAHLEEDASFAYGDYWDGRDLVYTGRGQDGNQVLSGPNRDVAENARTLWLFEHVDTYQRRFLGNPTCVGYWWAVAPDKHGTERRVLRFRLSLENAAAPPAPREVRSRRPAHRRPRPFDETAVPSKPSFGTSRLTSDEIAQLTEKANTAHHGLLVALKRRLEADGWTDIEEIPAAIDLWARRAGARVLFEAKTIPEGKELSQTRSALSQLLEYRFFYGDPTDLLCLVMDSPISDRRLRFLDAMGVCVLWYDAGEFQPSGPRTLEVFASSQR